MRTYTERMSFTLPIDEKRKLKHRARVLGISMSELVRHILEKSPIGGTGQSQ